MEYTIKATDNNPNNEIKEDPEPSNNFDKEFDTELDNNDEHSAVEVYSIYFLNHQSLKRVGKLQRAKWQLKIN